MDQPRGFIHQCEQEELHLSGAIQPHGALIITDSSGIVTHLSANCKTLLDDAADSVSLGQFLPAMLRDIASVLPALPPGGRYVGQCDSPQQEFDVVVTPNEGGWVYELYPVETHPDPMAMLNGVIPVPVSADELAEQCQSLIEALLTLSGFDRVLYYRFMPEGDGEVLVEARREGGTGSYQGLRFPASDIPYIARELYLKNPWRTIPDATAAPVPIFAAEANVTPDLSYVDLRSVSPVHLEYMANMGVSGAISLPIIQAGELDALISCHCAQPRQLTVSQLQAMRSLSEGFNLRLRDYKARRRLDVIDGLQHYFDHAKAVLMRHGELESAWDELSAWLMDTFAADGVMLQMGGEYYQKGVGLTPNVMQIVAQQAAQASSNVWISDCLRRDCSDMPLSEVAGVALISDLPLDQHHFVNLYLCRVEHLYEVVWGGNPDKPVDYREGSRTVSPRRSFESWIEQRVGYSRPWSASTRLYLLKLRTLLQQAKSMPWRNDGE